MVTELNSAPIVQVRDFHKRYRKQIAVDGVNLDIQRGEIYGLIGPDGSGKSSLMKAIAGVLSFEGGSLEVFSTRIDSERSAEQVKDRLGFMPQGLGLNLYRDLSVEENIDFFAQLRQVPANVLVERKQKLLAMTRLDRFLDRPMKQLSGGMKQKLGLVCTLIHEPDFVILDEPTTGVDPVSRRDFWTILAELLRERGITALVSTAYMDEASRFQRLSLMYEGRVLATGEPDEIKQQASGSLVELSAEPQVEVLERLKTQFSQVESVGSRIRVFVGDKTSDVAIREVSDLLTGLKVSEIKAAAPELEDAFIALLHRRKLVTKQIINHDFPNQHGESPDDEAVTIKANGLTRDFDSFRAVDHASFSVRQGEIFGLLGANGAGKTTLIKMLTGILTPTEGEGQVAGADLSHAAQSIKERIGYMSQAFSLYQDMTVMENIRLYARIYGVGRKVLKPRIEQIVELAGLHGLENRLAGKLPLGIRQRLALGCALVHQPRILFLDEPTSGVDPIGRRRFWDILVHLSRVEQVTILITTHYMSEAEHCDRLALMHSGQIIADASPKTMKQALHEDAGELLEITVDQPLVALKLLEQAGYEGVALFGKRIHLIAKDPQKAIQHIQSLFADHNLQLFKLIPQTATLEDVFIYRIMEQEEKEALT